MLLRGSRHYNGSKHPMNLVQISILDKNKKEVHKRPLWLCVFGARRNEVSAIDAYNCKFQGRLIFDNEKDIKRAKLMGIENLNKKYDLKEIIKGDSIFCATGITSGDLVKGINLKNNKYITQTLVTHKSSNTCEILTREDTIKT